MLYGASMLIVAAVGVYHEAKARGRETRQSVRDRLARERHDTEMRELTDALRLIRAAIYQRTTLEADVVFLLKAIENHATHLEEMGRDKPMKYAPLHK